MGSPTFTHKKAQILSSRGLSLFVDEELQSLMQFYADNDIQIWGSNHDRNGFCWIEYALFQWMEIIEWAFQSDSKELFDFIEEKCVVKLQSMDDGDLDPNDEDNWIEGDNLVWSSTVEFDRDLLPTFEALIKSTLPRHIEMKRLAMQKVVLH
jgi:hypothetical protein